MEELEAKTLEALGKLNGRPIGCGTLGDIVFDAKHKRGSAPYARIMGKVLKRLKEKRLAQWGKDCRFHYLNEPSYGWTIVKQ